MSKPAWTLEALKEHFEALRVDDQRAVEAALSAAKEAVTAAEVNAERWRNSSNEWRGAMSDRERTFISRAEVRAFLVAVAVIAASATAVIVAVTQ
jgi:hypothetical protein